jgi:sporulation-control protein
MGFKRLMAGLGAGGASVETELRDPNTVPGGTVSGEVRIEGGKVDQRIDQLVLALQARVEVEGQDGEVLRDLEFHREVLGGAVEIQPEQVFNVPFTLSVPWESPVTVIAGQELSRMRVGVRTELAVARAIDPGDFDPITVHPAPAQADILDAFGALGFRFKHADLEKGHIRGTRQTLPFYQEIEFTAPQQYPGLKEVELSFVAGESSMDVVLEMDKKPGLFSLGGDSFRSFVVEYATAGGADWADYLNRWLHEVGGKRSRF